MAMTLVRKLADPRGGGTGRVLVSVLVLLHLFPSGVFGASRWQEWGRAVQATSGAASTTRRATLPKEAAEEASDRTAQESLVRLRLRTAFAQRLRYVDARGSDVTALQLESFLAAKRSPLAAHAGDIIASSNRHRIDPKLIVAIAGVESDFGRVCRGFNAWGWANGRKRWHSWPESIDEFARLIAERYPHWYNVRKMAGAYNPVTPASWGRKVAYLMESVGRAVPV